MTQAYNLAQLANNVNSSGQLNAATALNGITPVANGGSGLSTIAANNVILGNGTSAVQVVAPGTSGNVLTSNGTTWASTAIVSGFSNMTVFTSSGTWTVPAGITKAKVTVIGGGGGGGSDIGNGGGGGGGGGASIKVLTGLSGSITVTVGNGGTTTGGSSSFGSLLSATGGGVGANSGLYGIFGGTGGIGSLGSLNIAGSGGSSPAASAGGPGGSSIFGGGARSSGTGSGSGDNGGAYGGGGGGADVGFGGSGGTGAAGVVIIEY